jgi:hypothetical protein
MYRFSNARSTPLRNASILHLGAQDQSVTFGERRNALPILVRRRHNHAIHAEGVPLGLLEHIEYEDFHYLEKGDLLEMSSDGILEAMNPQNESSARAA